MYMYHLKYSVMKKFSKFRKVYKHLYADGKECPSTYRHLQKVSDLMEL